MSDDLDIVMYQSRFEFQMKPSLAAKLQEFIATYTEQEEEEKAA
jgi:hypothetical protein